jgi:hypothetical protein
VTQAAGFGRVYHTSGNYEAHVLAFKSQADAAAKALFGLPDY